MGLLGALFGGGATAVGNTTAKPPQLFGGRNFNILAGGNSPKDFGMSPFCARLRRKNRLRRLGIGADHC